MEPFIVVELQQTKETKNMVRYDADKDEEVSRRANVPNLYVRKTVLAAAFNGFPQKIKVTIEGVK
jgi:hypothetical protein